MTANEFNAIEFNAYDRVELTMNDGSIKEVILQSGNAYLGRGEYVIYTTKEKVEAEPAKLLYNDFKEPSGSASKIDLDDIKSIKKV
jgi:hypothetical protein